MTEPRATGKRFYEAVNVITVDGGYGISLDERPVPTPLGQVLVLPTEALADAVAGEWRAQGDSVDPRSMPLSGLANTAIDRTGARRLAVIDEALGYGATDLLCYWTEQPEDLAQAQHDCWQPLLDWANDCLGVHMLTTTGLSHIAQPSENAEALKHRLQALDDLGLTAVAALTAQTSSLIVALAVWEGRIGADEAFDAAQLDETWQNERWGLDPEIEARQKNLRADITAAANFITLARILV